MKRILTFVMVGALFMTACHDSNTSTGGDNDKPVVVAAPTRLSYSVINVYPHDTASFTQGLLVYNGQLYEGTGGSPEYSHYKSWVGTVNMTTGKPIQQVTLGSEFFGEGITIMHDKLYQLTWMNHKGFVYDAKSLKKLAEFSLKTQGWGITNDSSSLIISDGTSNLYFLNPGNYAVTKTVNVTAGGEPVGNLNELEYINGYVYANRWGTNEILKINPVDGKVIGVADLSGLLQQYAPDFLQDDKIKTGDAVLNGIAYDPATGKIYITGKLWPKLFEVKID